MPKIKILECEDDFITFRLTNCTHAMANALRRIIISEIPCLSFDSAQIKVNTSFINDEMLAHRIGLIPIACDNIEEFNIPEKCECSSVCPKCQVIYRLKVSAGQEKRIVYSSDLKNDSSSEDSGIKTRIALSKDPSEKLILAKLGAFQSLDILVVARKGIGREHAKWQCAFVKFNYKDEEENDNEHASNDLQQEGYPTEFEMKVESMGQMPPEAVVKMALKVLREKIEFVREEFKKIDEGLDDSVI